MFNFLKKPKNKKAYKVQGMHCASCAAMIESDLEDAGFVAKCSYAKQIVEINDDGTIDEKRIKEIVKNAGYEVTSSV